MFKVFQFSNLSLGSANIHHKFMSLPQSKCSICKSLLGQRINGPFSDFTKQSRNRSTNVSILHFDKTLKKKKIKKKLYTELLEVSGDNASERRAKVKTITARNISKLNREGFNTSSEVQPYEYISLTKESVNSNFKPEESVCNKKELNEFVMEEVEEMEEVAQENSEEFIEDDVTIEHPEILNQVALAESTETSAKTITKVVKRTLGAKVKEALCKVKFSELDKAGKEKSLANLLVSYIDVCVNCGFVNRALATLNHYLNVHEVNVNDTRVFDALLSGYAKFGSIDKLLDLWQVMVKNNINPSVSSYSYRIECIARSSKREKNSLLNDTLRLMSNDDIPLNKLFVDMKWKNNSREVVLEAIKAVRPNFKPILPKLVLNYNNTLVEKLNYLQNSKLKPPAEGLLNVEELKILFNEQLKQEMACFVRVRSIERSQITDTVTFCRNKFYNLQNKWEKIVLHAFQRDLAALNSLHQKVRNSCYQLNIYPYLTVLDKNEYKEIIMNEIRRLAEGKDAYCHGMPMLYRNLGNQVRIRYENKLKSDEGLLVKLKGVYYEFGKWYLGTKSDGCINGRQKWNVLVNQYQNGPSLDLETVPWTSNILVGIGRFLYNIILRELKIDVNIMKKNVNNEQLLPAFYTVYKTKSQTTKEEVKPHPILARLYLGACLPLLNFNVAEVPMVVPPIPWTSLTNGGYIVARSNIIRLPQQAVLQWERLNSCPKAQLFPCFDSLTQLGSIPWKVNREVLDLVIKVFNNGGDSKLSIPEPPSSYQVQEPEVTDSSPLTKEDKYKAYRKRMQIRRKKAEMYSLWCDALYKLSLANHFRDKIFWLPHNMDFRGRVYPCPPHLNHLSSDMSRSLLCFAKGEPLGSDGLNWLKIHLINLTGLKKKNSIKERLKYGNSILPLILDSANKPLDGEKWWMQSEEPWQTLACCIEIKNALQCTDGPEKYKCHFPVHQDGSCNGLQHYAALGRDASGAYSVNLSPCEEPQDVYSCVAAIVERERIKDALEGVTIAQVLESFVRRKVIKQTVMTTVYGVTRFGARLQIAKQLKDIDDFPKEYVWQASTYLVAKTFSSLREMFTSTREIQDWLTESANLISNICGQNVEYVTPLGLSVVQPYIKNQKISNNNQVCSSIIHSHYGMDMFVKPNIMKQRNAFPPNFIHSLDSTHMMLTSLHCEQAGITFVSVHDCFWTHPNTIHKMNRVCREQFVSLHSQPILKNLSKFLVNKFGYNENEKDENENITSTKKSFNLFLKNIPTTGDFNLADVLESPYFFS